MLDANLCFKELKTTTKISDYLKSRLETFTYSNILGFDQTEISKDFILEDDLLKTLNNHFIIKNGSILRMDKFKCYKWHLDFHRGVSINMLLSDNISSSVYFRKPSDENPDQFDIVKLDYKPNTFYLFNNQIEHTVFNFENIRYLFSINFLFPKTKLTYNEVLNYVQNN